MDRSAGANSRPQISIVIPCFNRERFIADAIQSAISQGTFVEVVVVDDGSTDDSWQIISSFENVRAVRTENRGVSAARNTGAGEAQGQLLRFLDSDDRIPVGALAQMLRATQMLGDNEIAVGEGVTIDAEGNPTTGPLYGFPAETPQGVIARRHLLASILSCYLPLFPKAAFDQCGGFDESIGLGEDLDLAFRILSLGYDYVRVPIIVAEIREHSGERLSRNIGRSGFSSLLKLYRSIWTQTCNDSKRPASGLERSILAGRIWTTARDASRAGFRMEAESLYAFSTELGGNVRIGSSKPIEFLYRFFSPYRAEQILQFAKMLTGQRRGTT